MIISVRFIQYFWDNHQGGQGTLVERVIPVDIDCNTKLDRVKPIAIELINNMGIYDNWTYEKFTGTTIISILIE